MRSVVTNAKAAQFNLNHNRGNLLNLKVRYLFSLEEILEWSIHITKP